jgi:formate hydrogenlyase subunit 5
VTAHVGAAFWYEREIQDMFGLVPVGHPRPEPLTLPLPEGSPDHPCPGDPALPARVIDPDPRVLPRHVMGPGLFTIPHGPVRSGVMESIEYLVETPGEDIPHLNMRVFYKHRGIEKRFEQLTPADGVLPGAAVPPPARLVRMLHAELERIAGYLDVVTRLADAAGLAVATTRFAWHKEQALRLVSRLCGSRWGRGVVVPGGIGALPQLPPGDLAAAAARLEKAITADYGLLMRTSSFLDRLRGTGPLRAERAAGHGALGPVGRASGFTDDSRFTRPYDGYARLSPPRLPQRRSGDAMARLQVRLDELAYSFRCIEHVAGALPDLASQPVRAGCGPAEGRAAGWAEAPHGEVLYDVQLSGGRITRCRPRSASFHNLVLMHEVFTGDILTDFPFIEASFGLSAAGVAL